MKLVLRITVTALLAALIAVPAASAKPGGGNGHGKGAGKAKAAHEHKAGKEKKAKKDKSAKQAGKADKAKKHGKKAEAESCEAPGAAAAVLSGLFGSASECSADEQEQAALALEPPNLEGLGPGQYCHQLEAWMVASGGDFSQTFGTEQSGYANDHGKCASRRAHGEDLLAAATEALPEAEQAPEEQALELPNLEGLGPGRYCHELEAWMAANGGNFSQTFGSQESGYANDHGKCASRRAHGEDLLAVATETLPEQEQAQQGAPAAAELTIVLRLLSF